MTRHSAALPSLATARSVRSLERRVEALLNTLRNAPCDCPQPPTGTIPPDYALDCVVCSLAVIRAAFARERRLASLATARSASSSLALLEGADQVSRADVARILRKLAR